MRSFSLILTFASLGLATPAAADGARPEMARIPAGRYVPMMRSGPVAVDGFLMDRLPVTRAEYLAFVRANPRWRRGQAPRAATGAGYLASWPSALSAGTAAQLRRPVTEVSWVAARAYCQAKGKRLPTTAEWEYAARASETRRDASGDVAFTSRLVALYTSRAARNGAVGSTFRNVYGVADLHGLVWEWTEDYDHLKMPADARTGQPAPHTLACAGGSLGTSRPADYAAFLRYGVRGGLDDLSTSAGLGFRCAAG